MNSVIEPKLEVKEETLKAKSSDLSSNNLMKILEMSQEFKRPKYFCDVCHVNNNSQMNLKQHLAGKKHLKMKSSKSPSTKGQNFVKKNLLVNKEMVFKNGVNNVQTAGYNGKRTVS